MEPRPSILGEARARLPITGRIRPGIQVLTKGASSNPRIVEAYDRGMREGQSYEEIAKAIEALGYTKKPLIPLNTDHFAVKREHFINPAIADLIIEKYGEVRPGTREKRVYQLPIILPTDDWLLAIPHEFAVMDRGGKHFWSEYDSDGVRRCMYPAPLDPDPKNRRRTGAGRPILVRQDNGGRCEPEKCPEYQSRKCRLTGAFQFYVAGIPGLNLIQVPTNSFYSLKKAMETLKMVRTLRGRISGLHQGRPFLWLIRNREWVTRIMDDGQVVREKQWLIGFESPEVDAMSFLNEPTAEPRLVATPGQATTQPAVQSGEAVNESPEALPDPYEGLDQAARIEGKKEELFTRVITTMGVPLQQYIQRNKAQYSDVWSKDEDAIDLLLAEARKYESNPEDLKALIQEFFTVQEI